MPGHGSNFQDGPDARTTSTSLDLSDRRLGRRARHRAEPVWKAGATSTSWSRSAVQDDPNVTNKKFAGNPTRSYRTRDPLRVVGEVDDWEGHPPEVLQMMLDNLERLRAQGLDVILD